MEEKMSYVTDIILISHYLKQDTIDEINGWLIGYQRNGLYEVTEHAGGSKAMQCEVHMGAFNYLGLEEFLEFIKTLPWEEKKQMQLLTKEKHDDKFTLRRI